MTLMWKKYYNNKFEKKYYPAFLQVQYEELMTYASIVIYLSLSIMKFNTGTSGLVEGGWVTKLVI